MYVSTNTLPPKPQPSIPALSRKRSEDIFSL